MLKLEHLAWDLPDREGIIKDLDLTVEDGKTGRCHRPERRRKNHSR